MMMPKCFQLFKCTGNEIWVKKNDETLEIPVKHSCDGNGKGVVLTTRPLVCLAKFKVNDIKYNDSCVQLYFPQYVRRWATA